MNPKTTMTGRAVLAFASAFAMPLVLTGSDARAASSASGDEFLANIEAVPPNIIFLIDLTMTGACGEDPDDPDTSPPVDTSDSGTGDTGTKHTGDTGTRDTGDTGTGDTGTKHTGDTGNYYYDSGYYDSGYYYGYDTGYYNYYGYDTGNYYYDSGYYNYYDSGYYYGYDSGYYYNYYGYDTGNYYNYYNYYDSGNYYYNYYNYYDSGNYYYNYYNYYDSGYYNYLPNAGEFPGAIGDNPRSERRSNRSAAANRTPTASADGGGDGGGDTGGLSQPCINYVFNAIEQVTKHYDWAYFGVVATSTSGGVNTFTPVAPVGSTPDEIRTALLTLDTSDGVRNLAEAISSVADDYLSNTTTGNSDPWDDAPIQYSCQDNHIITITSGPPSYDQYATNVGSAGMSVDVVCDDDYIKVSPDEYCLYDNLAYQLYNNFDARTDLADDQNVTMHTLGVTIDGADLAEELYGNASDVTDSNGMYIVANSGDEILAKLLYVLNEIRAGYYSRSAPVVTADGQYMIYSFYQIAGLTAVDGDDKGSSILAQGHVRAYQLDDDPTSATYGQVLYNGSSQFGGALWDAGDLLVSRPVLPAEENPMDQDGFGQRDIFTFVPEVAASITPTDKVWSEDSAGSQTDDRMNFDSNFVDAVDGNGLLGHFMDSSNLRYDMDGDDDVDADDLQDLVDFTRGLPEATFRYLEQERGYWKLGDSPYATPAVVTARNSNYSSDATYRRFLTALENAQKTAPAMFPDIVLIPANDGMLHAFSLEDYLDAPSTALGSPDDEQAGEELWAWMLSYPMYRYDDGSVDGEDDYTEGWSGRLVDLMLYGRTYIFDGSPVVEDVWVDMDGDGLKTCWASTFPDGCEWRRVVVVQQGKGGPSTLALDITVPTEPRFLWEHLNPNNMEDWGGTVDPTGLGQSLSRPVVVNLYDREAAHGAVHDRWVAIWGSGRAVPFASSTSYYAMSEPALFFHHLSADHNGEYMDAVTFTTTGSNGHPEAGTTSGLDPDSDGRYEYGYISGAVAAIDYDSDGDVDVLYFPVTASYEPSDLGDPDSDTMMGINDMSEPGSTWMYKAVLDTEDLDNPTWCEFVDPVDYGVVDANGNGYRPEVFYSATAAWHDDGTLGIYWGSGTPYDRMSVNPGYFFGFKDMAALSCPAQPEPICNTTGMTQMDAGEGLTGDPIIYSSVIYFPTYVPDLDRCENGTGRIWGLDYETCGAGLDTDGDGEADSSNMETPGYPSEIVVTEQGKLLWGSSNVADDSSGIVSSMTPIVDPFNGVDTLMLREVF